MYLTNLSLRNFRCFKHIELSAEPGVNLVVGDNASGKTSILEAIFMLGRGQSFRGQEFGPVVRSGCDDLVVTGKIEGGGRSHHVGLTRDKRGVKYKLDGDISTRRFDLVTALPLQLIDPNLHRLLELGPRFRRHFLDWGVFHVEHRFFPAWRAYRRALRQRNRALRSGQSGAMVSAWDAGLIQAADVIHDCRRRYVERLNSALPDTVVRLLGEDAPIMRYYPGWNDQTGFREVLAGALNRDRRSGYTHFGPHRADLKLVVDGNRARARVSRGQQKVFAAALLLTQARILKRDTGTQPVMLVDDIAAELGAHYLDALLAELVDLKAQCFITCLDSRDLLASMDVSTMFHVEHGRVVRANK